MIKIYIFNNQSKQTFTKKFDDFGDARRFLIRCQYSRKLDVIEVDADNHQEGLDLLKYY